MQSPQKIGQDVPSIVGKGITSEVAEELNHGDISNMISSGSPPTSPKE